MKKKIISILLFLFSACYGYSQVSWNVKAGMNLSTITPMDMNEKKAGYQFGVGMDYYFTKHWGIQPSLMLISKGYKDKAQFDYWPPEEWEPYPFVWKSYYYTENRVYMSMPVMLAYRFNLSNTLRLVFNGGGYISYGIAGRIKGEQTLKADDSTEKIDYSSFSAGTKRFDTGLGAGTALEFKNRYTLNLFGELGLKNVLGGTKNRTVGLNVGYKF